MTNLVNHIRQLPQFQAFLDALTESPEDAATIAATVDWLLENNATLPDVLLLYAGEPPEYEGGVG